jgi:hypothetical protein
VEDVMGTLIDDLIHTVERAEQASHHAPVLLTDDAHGPFLVYEQQPAPAALAGVA